MRSPGEAEVLRDSVVSHHHWGLAGPGGAGGEEEVFAVFSVGLLPPPHQAQSPAPPGELPALADDGPEEGAGLLQAEEGGQLQVGEQERDHRGREGGEEGTPPGVCISGVHHHHSLSLTHRVSLYPLQHSNNTKALRSIFPLFVAERVELFIYIKQS